MIDVKNTNILYPLISIVIPVYNVELYLEQSLESVLKQTYTNLQVILVDDGSTDSSSKICEDFEKKDNRFEVYRIQNGGQSVARNIGLTKVKGDYVTFLDSDDVLDSTIIETLLQVLVEYSSDISMCCPSHFYGIDDPEFNIINKTGVKTKDEVLLDMFYQRDFTPSVWGKLFKWELFNSNLRFKENKIFEDVDILPRLLERSSTVSYTFSKLYGYRHREKSTTTNIFSDKDLDIIDVCDDLIKQYHRTDTPVGKAVLIYKTNCDLRIWLTAPRIGKYDRVISKASDEIKNMSMTILKNSNVRIKLKIAIILFLCFRPLIFYIHSKVNRWK
ncbi:glycosyltransferase [Lactococcus lactis]|uniref:glycosyltransferase family 2 protein n=1 Tax=Lactococcus lactis TaxID=1358 RepID=UPI00288F9FA3|nr:glycosyltransferase [Lactococcus lactis]MDT2886051.1 glycosyltransferase [Lactococcus lactis]